MRERMVDEEDERGGEMVGQRVSHPSHQRLPSVLAGDQLSVR